MQIYACGDFYETASEPPRELKTAVQEAIGEPVRRIGRFIQLALIGAGRCVRDAEVPPDTAVYFSSGRGDLETTLDVMTGLFRDGQPPKPLSFVNTVSNAACFYVARALKLQGRSNFVCNRHFAFESVLQLALIDIGSTAIKSALVGAVDVACVPLAAHRRRLIMDADSMVGEGSHWIWTGPPNSALPRLGEILAAEHFGDRQMLLDWLARQKLSASNCLLSAGQFMSPQTFAEIRRLCSIGQSFDYREGRAHYDCQSAAVIGEFLKSGPRTMELVHINSNPSGQFSVIHVRH